MWPLRASPPCFLVGASRVSSLPFLASLHARYQHGLRANPHHLRLCCPYNFTCAILSVLNRLIHVPKWLLLSLTLNKSLFK